jgi:hypothetical protein
VAILAAFHAEASAGALVLAARANALASLATRSPEALTGTAAVRRRDALAFATAERVGAAVAVAAALAAGDASLSAALLRARAQPLLLGLLALLSGVGLDGPMRDGWPTEYEASYQPAQLTTRARPGKGQGTGERIEPGIVHGGLLNGGQRC